ncbi:MAG: DUF3857 domain-containing protein [Dysgonomonas sp.]
MRDYSVVLSQSNINNAEYSVKKVVTVLNRQGDHFANFHVIGDKFREYSDISGILMDANGNVIKKIKKGDFSVSSLKDSYTLLSDSYDIFYTCQSPTYPYTIQYTYQVKMKNGVISYPPFFPFDSYQQAVEQASMKMEIPANIQLRYKSNYNDNFKIDKKENKNIYSVSVSGLKAKLFEAFAPGYDKIFPFIMFAPTDFCYDSHCGNMSDWKHYGLWVSDLLKGRDAIPNELSEKIKDLTKDAKTPAEKVKIVYEYLQNNTRYVSIQLGIGGLQPIDATSVYKTRYGDCKGLTNLMKAMLKSINIQSNYCEIYSGDRNQRLYSDFANVNQTNHAILLVPMEKDSIWLECTSQTLPFGYIHDGIAGHDALVINEHGEGGKICRLPSYTKEQNKSSTKLIVNVNENGSAEGEVCFKRYLHNYYNAKRRFSV